MERLKIGGIYSASNNLYICFVVFIRLRYDHLLVYKIIDKSSSMSNQEINTILSYGTLSKENIRLIINGDLHVNGYLGQIDEKSMVRLKDLIHNTPLEQIKME